MNRSLDAFVRYLAAKRSLDDLSLHRRVWDRAWSELKPRGDSRPLEVLEIGAGIGTMVERVLEWTQIPTAHLTLLDSQAALLAEARRRIPAWALRQRWQADVESDGGMRLTQPGRSIQLDFRTFEIGRAIESGSVEGPWDLILAHAVLDLLDVERILPWLIARLVPGGVVLLTLNFDGLTAFVPSIRPELEARVLHAYHATMDERRVGGRPTGGSRTGRILLELLRAAGAEILDCGPSDWVVVARPGGYSEDERLILGYLLDTIAAAVAGRSDVSPSELEDWIGERRRQLEAGKLGFLAHQLDFAARRPASPEGRSAAG